MGATLSLHGLAAAAVTLALLSTGCGDGGSATAPPGGLVSEAGRCVVTVRLTGDAEISSGDVSLDYSRVAGGFGPPGPATRCRAVPSAMQGQFLTNFCDRDCDGGQGGYRYLQLSFFVSQAGSGRAIHGPADLFRCDFEGDASTLEFLVMDGHLAGPQGEMDGGQGLLVRTDCGHPQSSTTTTTSTTTSTLCDGDNCEDGPLQLEVWLDDDIAVMSIDVHATFPCDIGLFDATSLPPWDQWPGAGPVRCISNNDEIDLWATNQFLGGAYGNPPGTCEFLLGALSLSAIHGPAPLVTCTFEPAKGPVTAEDFDVTVWDVALPDDDGPARMPSASLRGFPNPER